MKTQLCLLPYRSSSVPEPRLCEEASSTVRARVSGTGVLFRDRKGESRVSRAPGHNNTFPGKISKAARCPVGVCTRGGVWPACPSLLETGNF